MFSQSRNNFKSDFNSAISLSQKALKIFNQHLTNGQLHSLENVNEEFVRKLDIYSGIDGVYIDKHKSIGGLAIRVQSCQQKNWRTFTIRYTRSSGAKTEYEKRKREIEIGYLFYPHFTMQSYFDNSSMFLGGALAMTKDLYQIIDEGDYKPIPNTHDDAKFLAVGFSDFVKYSVNILEISGDGTKVQIPNIKEKK